MAKKPTAEMIARSLTVTELVFLFCPASATDWQRAGITHATAQQMMIRGLIERQAAGSFSLTDQGRAVLEALMMRAATEGDRSAMPSMAKSRGLRWIRILHFGKSLKQAFAPFLTRLSGLMIQARR
jgi:hypothetical protein